MTDPLLNLGNIRIVRQRVRGRSRTQGMHAQAVQTVQNAFAPSRVAGISVVDELIREREEEACRESDE